MDLQLPASSIVSLFDTSKSERQSFVDSIISEIIEGGKNPLDIHIQLKMMESLLKDINERPEYKKALLEEAQKHGKSFSFHNAKIDIRDGKPDWDWDKCNDPELLKLQIAANEANAALKAKQDLLKKVPVEGLRQFDDETGEIYYIYPPSKTAPTIIAVTLK